MMVETDIIGRFLGTLARTRWTLSFEFISDMCLIKIVGSTNQCTKSHAWSVWDKECELNMNELWNGVKFWRPYPNNDFVHHNRWPRKWENILMEQRWPTRRQKDWVYGKWNKLEGTRWIILCVWASIMKRSGKNWLKFQDIDFKTSNSFARSKVIDNAIVSCNGTSNIKCILIV
jgi:hypothetical protein